MVLSVFADILVVSCEVAIGDEMREKIMSGHIGDSRQGY